jgi:hypothetical protein
MHRMIPVLALLGLLVAGPAAADHIFNFVTSIDDAQELSCGMTSDARGSGTATLNDISGLLTWNFTFGRNAPDYTDGLLQRGTESGAHIHGPAPIGVGGAGIQVALAAGSPKTGSATLNATQMNDLKAGLYYINIHSTGCPGGEIRGQLTDAPEGTTLPGAMPFVLGGLLALSIALALRTERTRA